MGFGYGQTNAKNRPGRSNINGARRLLQCDLRVEDEQEYEQQRPRE